jgi:hypothetical protein
LIVAEARSPKPEVHNCYAGKMGHMHMHHHHRYGTRYTPITGAGLTVVVWINVVLGLGMLAGAAYMVVLGLPTHNMGLIVGGGAGLGVGGLCCIIVGFAIRASSARRRRLVASGVPGTARVLGVTQTAMYMNNQPVVELELEITPAGGGPYVVSKREMVPMVMAGRLTDGNPLQVMVNPNKADDFIIQWDTAPKLPG